MVKVDKKWQKILKVPERMTKNLSLHDIWHFVIFGILLQVDKLTSLTLWRVDMLTSYQEFRIIWFWAPKFETTTGWLTYLLTRVKSRDASASKNLAFWHCCWMATRGNMTRDTSPVIRNIVWVDNWTWFRRYIYWDLQLSESMQLLKATSVFPLPGQINEDEITWWQICSHHLYQHRHKRFCHMSTSTRHLSEAA